MSRGPAGRRLGPGDVVDKRELETISGEAVAVPDPNRLVHLQLRRFAGCPFCNLHLQQIAARHDDIAAAGVEEVVVFHSSAESLRGHLEGEVPFAVVADPDKRLYRELGAEASPLSVLHPRAWPGMVRALRAKRRKLSFDLHGGPFGLPADFLITPDGRVVASRYGTHAYDQWSVDELLDLVRR